MEFKKLEKLITSGETETLAMLFDVWEGVSIQTDEDLTALGEIFDEDE
jgi:hypothetical protein